jgi:hypothetical protein
LEALEPIPINIASGELKELAANQGMELINEPS